MEAALFVDIFQVCDLILDLALFSFHFIFLSHFRSLLSFAVLDPEINAKNSQV